MSSMSTRSIKKHVSKRECLRSRQSRIISAIVVLIVILAAVIPPVVVTTLHKRNSMGPKSKVFVPLYIYPAPGAWAPLEDVYVSIFPCFHSNPNPPSRPLHLPRQSRFTPSIPKHPSSRETTPQTVRGLRHLGVNHAGCNTNSTRWKTTDADQPLLKRHQDIYPSRRQFYRRNQPQQRTRTQHPARWELHP